MKNLQSTNKAEILEKELSYKLYGIFLKVAKDYGHFGKEELYHNACEEELRINNVSYRTKSAITVFSKMTNKKIGIFVPDLIVAEKIIVEIKAQKSLPNEAVYQLLKYLEYSDCQVGYLVNFGTPYTQIIRKVYTKR